MISACTKVYTEVSLLGCAQHIFLGWFYYTVVGIMLDLLVYNYVVYLYKLCLDSSEDWMLNEIHSDETL